MFGVTLTGMVMGIDLSSACVSAFRETFNKLPLKMTTLEIEVVS